jgi:hypothetical protein
MMAIVPSVWKKIAYVAVGGLTEVGFVPGCSLLMVVSHQGRGIVDLVSGQRIARDRQETGSWLDAARPAVLGIGPVDGQWIEVAGLAGGRLPTATADGWQARRTVHGVALSGPGEETAAVQEAEEIRAFGFSPDGQAFILASSPGLTVFQRVASDCRLCNLRIHFPVSGMCRHSQCRTAMHKYAGRRAHVELAGPVGRVRFRPRTGGLCGRRGPALARPERSFLGAEASDDRTAAAAPVMRDCGRSAVGSHDGRPPACLTRQRYARQGLEMMSRKLLMRLTVAPPPPNAR